MAQLVFQFAKSARARAFARSGTDSKTQSDVLTLLAKQPALSLQEIAVCLGLGVQSICRPVLELLRAGKIVETCHSRITRYGGFASLVAVPAKKRPRKARC